MALLDKANASTYGTPVSTWVSTNIEKGPLSLFPTIIWHDLVLLLEQTKDKGANIYTHGEMLPHAYPELKKYAHLKGNFVRYCMAEPAKRIYGIPAAILFAINCIMLVKDSYAYHIFTTFVVSSPDI